MKKKWVRKVKNFKLQKEVFFQFEVFVYYFSLIEKINDIDSKIINMSTETFAKT